MTRILLLGATGRSGAAILSALPAEAEVGAALRAPTDTSRLVRSAARVRHVLFDLADPASIQAAMDGIEVVVNAIRLREDIAATELIGVHQRLLAAGVGAPGGAPRIVTIGGAGALRLPGGERFWQTPVFPRVTLPRGRAHAALRDHLESGEAGDAWAYLIPPPAFDPNGPATGRWERLVPAADETPFIQRAISYADFGAAVAETAMAADAGTQLIAWPQ